MPRTRRQSDPIPTPEVSPSDGIGLSIQGGTITEAQMRSMDIGMLRETIGGIRQVAAPLIVHHVSDRPTVEPVLSFDSNDEHEEDPFYGEEFEPEEDWSEIVASDFPQYEIPHKWTPEARDEATDSYLSNMTYRLRWVFERREKDGLQRTRYVQPFSPEDFEQRLQKAATPHRLNTPTNVFYDWNMGGVDFILRMERMTIKGRVCLRLHLIHKQTKKELGYQDRFFDGEYFREVNMVWASTE